MSQFFFKTHQVSIFTRILQRKWAAAIFCPSLVSSPTNQCCSKYHQTMGSTGFVVKGQEGEGFRVVEEEGKHIRYNNKLKIKLV